MVTLNYDYSEKLYKRIQEDLKNLVGPVPTPKIHIAEEIKTDNNLSEQIKEIFTEANEYDVEKIKRKLDMFLKTNNVEYLGKAIYLTKELMKDNM